MKRSLTFGKKAPDLAISTEGAQAATQRQIKEWVRWISENLPEQATVARSFLGRLQQAAFASLDTPPGPNSGPSIDSMLEIIRYNESVDDNGDPVGAQPESQWETGYAAGIRCLYRFLKGARPATALIDPK